MFFYFLETSGGPYGIACCVTHFNVLNAVDQKTSLEAHKEKY
jgi:hypothetical protein